MPTVTLTPNDIARLSEVTRAEIMTALGLGLEIESGSEIDLTSGAQEPTDDALSKAGVGPSPQRNEGDAPAELTRKMVAKLADNVSERARGVLRFFAESESGTVPIIRFTELYDDPASTTPLDMRALWAGLTKRVRTVTGDREAWLIAWDEDEDAGEETVQRRHDWIGRIDPATHLNLRRYFGLAS